MGAFCFCIFVSAKRLVKKGVLILHMPGQENGQEKTERFHEGMCNVVEQTQHVSIVAFKSVAKQFLSM